MYNSNKVGELTFLKSQRSIDRFVMSLTPKTHYVIKELPGRMVLERCVCMGERDWRLNKLHRTLDMKETYK